MSKVKFSKKSIEKAIKTTSNLEEAASNLGINRRTLYNLRVENRMPVAQRG